MNGYGIQYLFVKYWETGFSESITQTKVQSPVEEMLTEIFVEDTAVSWAEIKL